MDTPPTVLPAQRRAYTVLLHLLAGVTLPWFGLLVGVATGVRELGVAAFVAVLAAVLWSAARRWRERFEFHADRLVHWRNGRARTVAYDEVERVGLRWFDARQAFGAGQEAVVTFTPTSGEPLQLRGVYATVRGPVDLVAGAIESRLGARLRAGETLTFADRPGFPTRAVLSFLFFVLIAAASVGSLFWRVGGSTLRSFPQAIGLLVMTGFFMVRSLQTWREARRNGGLAVSARGVLPLVGYKPAQLATVDYRTTAVAAGDWIPWGAMESVVEDGFGLSFAAATVARPVVVSAATDNVLVLGRVLRREVARERAAVTGVRVDVGEEAEAEDAAQEVEEAAARRERGGGGQ